MTIGIYALSFEGTDKVYIGQSVDVETRYTIHLNHLSKGLCNNKLIEAYLLYGIPTLIFLEICSYIDDLARKEVEWIIEFDSFNNGLNMTNGGTSGDSASASNSKYSREQIIEIINLLADRTNYTYDYIANKTSIPYTVICKISVGETHLKLQKELNKREDIININNYRNKTIKVNDANKGIIYPVILDPLGNEYIIINGNKFAKDHGLDPGSISKLLNGKRHSVKGYTIKPGTSITKLEKVFKPIICPKGIIYSSITNLTEFSILHGLNNTSLSNLMSGRINSHKGWKIHGS